MSLFHRLLLSHAVPVVIVTFALGIALAALVRVGSVLTTLHETELETLHDEGELHRAAWALDVEMRHGQLSCARGHERAEVRRRVQVKAANLRTELSRTANVTGAMRTVTQDYLDVASLVAAGEICDNLLGRTLQEQRGQLDEQLTNLWVDRLGDLHRTVNAKQHDAQRIATSAAWVGIPLAVSSFAFAMWIAREMARRVREPLSSLAQAAQRVGHGDFATPVVGQGPPEILALAQDLERMRCQLQELDTLKQGFLTSVSHELRTPLSKIREALALLQDGAVGALDERKERVVRIARTACEREIRLVTTLLDLSRLRSGSPIHLRESAALDAVLQSALEDEAADAAQRGVQVELLASGEPGPCMLDPVLLERAIANLVRNAVSVSSKEQKVTVQRVVERSGTTGDPGRVSIFVRDHGPGVPPEVRSKVFDAFVTRPVPSSGKALGIGIGLALAREVARAHGGDLELLAGEGPGATFRMWLPLKAAPPVSASPPRGQAGLHHRTGAAS